MDQITHQKVSLRENYIKLKPIEIEFTRDLLNFIAAGQYSVIYGDLTKKYGIDPHSKMVSDALGNISTLCFELGLPLISVMGVLKDTHYPADGFNTICKILGVHQELNVFQQIEAEQRAVRECKDWWRLAEYLNIDVKGIEKPVSDPASDHVQLEGIEGKLIQINATAYERDPKLREACLKKYGAKCAICGFEAEAVYGEAFKGLIHIHHITPLGEIKGEHTVNPEKDLIPVCPNCHMILHSKRGGTYTPDEVRKMLIK